MKCSIQDRVQFTGYASQGLGWNEIHLATSELALASVTATSNHAQRKSHLTIQAFSATKLVNTSSVAAACIKQNLKLSTLKHAFRLCCDQPLSLEKQQNLILPITVFRATRVFIFYHIHCSLFEHVNEKKQCHWKICSLKYTIQNLSPPEIWPKIVINDTLRDMIMIKYMEIFEDKMATVSNTYIF